MDVLQVWLAGRLLGEHREVRGVDTEVAPWSVLGCYWSKEGAVSRCRRREDFVVPLEVDVDLPEREEHFPEIEWPLLEEGGAK